MMIATHLTVSIVIPTHNRARLVCEAIDSVLAQTRVPDEIIVVDDGSTDDTQNVLKKYQAPVIVVYQSNSGRSTARNVGMAHSTAELICFLDDDDTLTETSIEVRAAFLERNLAVDVVYGDIAMSTITGTHLGLYNDFVPVPSASGDLFAEFIQRNVRPIHAFMMRRACYKVVTQFRTDLSYLEDYHFWLQIAMYFHFGYINNVLGNYRLHANQTTTTKKDWMYEVEISVRNTFFDTTAFLALSPAQRARAYSIQATQYMLLGNVREARYWYRRTITTAPKMLRSYGLLALTIFGRNSFNQGINLMRRLRGQSALKTVN